MGTTNGLLSRYTDESTNEAVSHNYKAKESYTTEAVIPSKRKDASFISASSGLLDETDPSDLQINRSFIHKVMPTTGASERVEPVRLDHINAVISSINEQMIFMECELPSGSVELSFPKEMIPAELARYGSPISISVEIKNGYKSPKFEHRVVETIPFREEYDELMHWATTLTDA